MPGPLPETPFGLTKVFVDYLPRSNDGLLERLEKFLGCGKIIKMLKKSGKTSGYLVFKKPNSVRIALTKNDEEFEGKRLRLELPKGLTERSSKPKRTTGSVDASRQAFLSHLAKPVNPEIIREVVAAHLPALSQPLESIKMLSGKNSCFLTFASAADVATFCKKFDGFPLLGQQLQAVPAQAPGTIKKDGTWKPNQAEREEEEEEEGKEDGKPQSRPAAHNTVCSQVLAGPFPEDVSPSDVRKLFSTCGRILAVRKLRNKVTGAFTGVAAVRFAAPGGANRAVAMDGTAATSIKGAAATMRASGSDTAVLSVELDGPGGEQRKHEERKEDEGEEEEEAEEEEKEDVPAAVPEKKRKREEEAKEEESPEARAKRLARKEKNQKMRAEARKKKQMREAEGAEDSDFEVVAKTPVQEFPANDKKPKRATCAFVEKRPEASSPAAATAAVSVKKRKVVARRKKPTKQ